MKNIYKIAGLAFALFLSAGFVACGGDSGTSAKDDESSSSIVDESSSSKNSSSSIATNSSSSRNDSAKSSSSVSSSSSEVVQLIPYTTECPAGHVCTYAPTEQMNLKITYGELLDTRDYQVYKTVTIGTQTWMTQNLNYAYTGVPYSYTSGSTTYKSDSTSWCFNNVADSCAKYGRLYTWAAAIDSVALAKDADNPQTCGDDETCDRLSATALAANPIQGVCPSGWHLPSSAEWNAMFTVVGGTSNAVTKLKSASGWHSDGNGTDAYGFSAFPVGDRDYEGDFSAAGIFAGFWSASQDEGNSYLAYGMHLFWFDEDAALSRSPKSWGRSVRCIRNSN